MSDSELAVVSADSFRNSNHHHTPAHYSPHSFRATGITNVLENDDTLEAAQANRRPCRYMIQLKSVRIRRFKRIDDASMSTGLRSSVINFIVGYKDEAPVRNKTFRIDSYQGKREQRTEKFPLRATQGTLR